MSAFLASLAELDRAALIRPQGRILRAVGLTVEARAPGVAVGDLCRLETPEPVLAEVAGFRDGRALLVPLSEPHGLRPGTVVTPLGGPLTVPVGPALLGRVIDAYGVPIDGRGPLGPTRRRPTRGAPVPAVGRARVTEPLPTGVRAIDGLLTLGRGQRVGIFAGSGVGKSTLLGMLARHTAADVSVVGLVGERAREVQEFLDGALGPEGLARSVVVVATADAPAQARRQAAFTATTVAEAFRDAGQAVLLLVDSLTRVAMAQREIGLGVGEPPATRGYPPSVFALLPRLAERAGTTDGPGAITAVYTVLVEGDDLLEPVADTARATLDGHIVLTRELGERGHWPAIDVPASVSRCQPDLVSDEHRQAAARLRALLAARRDVAPLLALGAWRPGGDPLTDRAVALWPALERFLRQAPGEPATWPDTVRAVLDLAREAAA